MWTRAFWKDTAERVLATAAEVAIPAFAGASLWDIDYLAAAGLTGAAAVAALLKAIIASTRGVDSASLVEAYVGRHREQ